MSKAKKPVVEKSVPPKHPPRERTKPTPSVPRWDGDDWLGKPKDDDYGKEVDDGSNG